MYDDETKELLQKFMDHPDREKTIEELKKWKNFFETRLLSNGDRLKIGDEFYLETSSDRIYQCTDIGKRTVLGIWLDPSRNKADFIGPSYSVLEIVFDEDDLDLIVIKKEVK